MLTPPAVTALISPGGPPIPTRRWLPRDAPAFVGSPRVAAEEAAGRGGAPKYRSAGALYFSKKLIPYLPADSSDGELSPVRLHIGIYAYRPKALSTYASLPPSDLEELEGLEQLRFLAAGIPIDVVEVETPPFTLRELNNPEDVEPIEAALAMAGLE